MAGFGYRQGLPGAQYVPNRLAEMLARQNINNGTTAGGLGHMLQQFMIGKMMRDDQVKADKAVADEGAANQAMVRGMNAQQWTPPDEYLQYGSESGPWMTREDAMDRAAPAGGYEGAVSALTDLPGNPYAGRLTQDLLMKSAERKMGMEDEERKRAGALDDYLAKKQIDQEFPAAPKPSDVPMNVREWEYYQKLPEPLREDYLRMKRADKFIDTGSQMIAINPAGPDKAPAAIYDKTLKPGEQPEVKAAQEAAKVQAKAGTEAKIEYPKVKADAEHTIQLVEDLLAHPGMSDVVGAPNPLTAWTPGTSAADFRARLDQIKGKQFMQAYQGLKGGGQITEVEGAKAEMAISRMRASQSEKEFVAAGREFQDIIRKGLERAARDAGAAAHDALPAGITEDDILETMRANNMTRQEVLNRLMGRN